MDGFAFCGEREYALVIPGGVPQGIISIDPSTKEIILESNEDEAVGSYSVQLEVKLVN